MKTYATYNGKILDGFPISGNTISIKYNGSEIASVSTSNLRKMLECSYKHMRSNVTINTNILKCENKRMRSNVEVGMQADTIGARFVYTGYGSCYSTDGTSWKPMIGTQSAYSPSVGIDSVVYGKGKFVCVGGAAFYSTENIAWILSADEANQRYGVTYGDGRFVCVGVHGLSYYSTDGISWVAMSGLDTNYSYISVAYGNSMFVCVGRDNYFYYSTDGTSWKQGSFTAVTYNSVVYGNDRFVCVGAAGKSAYSTDGLTWNEMTGLPRGVLDSYAGVAYGNGRFVCVGHSVDGYPSYYSTDGASWHNMTGIDKSVLCSCVTYGNGRFVCVGDAGKAYYSTNGTSWSSMSELAISKKYYGGAVAYGG